MLPKQPPTPPTPEKPEADDCCASACVPYIFNLYEQRLFDWQDRYGDQVNGRQSIHQRQVNGLNTSQGQV